MKISSVILTIKNNSKQALALSLEIKAWLEEQGILISHQPGSTGDVRPDSGDPAPGLIIILGGDGTILSRARNLLDLEIPFLGINLGKVGFMTEISPHSWRDELTGMISGDAIVSQRMVLGYEIIRQGESVEKGCAINEVVVNRAEMARLITVGLDLPGKVRQDIRSDGIIFSTPTGSTAYSVSAGGPLVHPDLEVMIITPICPFLHDFSPLVLPCTETVFACIAEPDSDAFLTVDGQLGFRLVPGDFVRISRHARDFKLLCSPSQSFASKLVDKGFLRRKQ